MLPFQEIMNYGFLDFTANLVIYVLLAVTAFVTFWVIYKERLKNRKIQQNRGAQPGLIRSEIRNSLFSLVILTIMDVAVYIAQLKGYTKIYTNVYEYGWLYLALSTVVMILLHDTWFYFTHRLMHHPKVYKHVHKVHHQSTDPSPFAAFSFHPFEAVIDGGVFVFFAFTFPVHMIALWIWQLIHVVLNIISHLGYEIYPKGFNKHWLFKFKTPTTHHNMHHAKAQGNYGLYFTWWDKLLKTEFKDYHQVYDSIHNRVSKNEKEPAQPYSATVINLDSAENFGLNRKAS